MKHQRVTHSVVRPVYRLLQRAIVLEAVTVMTARIAGLVPLRCKLTEPLEIAPLSTEQLQEFIGRGEAPYCESLVERLGEASLACVGAISEMHLLSFVWFHRGFAEAEMNYGSSPATATPIRLAPDAAFVFHAYTTPQARGKRLLPAILAHAGEWLQNSKGVTTLVTTTEIYNEAARAALYRVGFDDVGTYWRFGLGKRVFGWYPEPAAPIIAYGLGKT